MRQNFFTTDNGVHKEVIVNKLGFRYDGDNIAKATILIYCTHGNEPSLVKAVYESGSHYFLSSVNLYKDKECKNMVEPSDLGIRYPSVPLRNKAYYSSLSLNLNNGYDYRLRESSFKPIVLIDAMDNTIVLDSIEKTKKIRIFEMMIVEEERNPIVTQMVYDGYIYTNAMYKEDYDAKRPTKVVYNDGKEEFIGCDNVTKLTDEQMNVLNDLGKSFKKLRELGVSFIISQETMNLVAVNTNGKKLVIGYEERNGETEFDIENSCVIVNGAIMDDINCDSYVYLD